MSDLSPPLLQRLTQTAVDPHVFDFWAARVNPLWSWSRPLARVVERRVEAQDTVTLVLKPNRHFHGFRPGQHINVTAEVHGRRVTRSYSLTDIPKADGLLSITAQAVAGGRLSTHLCRRTRVGDVLEIGQAFGDMTLPAQPQGRWLLLAAGSGITPLVSLTRQMAALGMPVDTTVLYWARTRAQQSYATALRTLAHQHPRLRVRFMLTREPAGLALLPDEGQGRMQDGHLAEWLAPAGGPVHVRACGPHAFVSHAEGLLRGQVASFQAEAFSPPPPPALDAAEPRTVRLHLAASGRTLEVPTGQSLLSALEDQDLKPASGCRMGVCHTCVCPKTAGATQDLLTGERSSEPDTALRLCVSRAAGDLTLDL